MRLLDGLLLLIVYSYLCLQCYGYKFIKFSINNPLNVNNNKYLTKYNNLIINQQSIDVIDNKNDIKVSKSKNIKEKALVPIGLLFLVFIDKSIHKQFQTLSIKFPSSLSGMLLVYSSLLFINKLNSKLADSILVHLLPSLSFLRTWLALFFIPPLIVLPLKLSLISGNELKLFFIVWSGLLISLSTTGYVSNIFKNDNKENIEVKSSPAIGLPSPIIPLVLSTITLGLSVNAKINSNTKLLYQLVKVYGIQSTIASFFISNKWINNNVKKVFHPVIICSLLTILFQNVFSALTDIPLTTILSSYYGSKLNNGAGDLISSMLGPAIVSFGIQLFQYRQLIQNNLLKVLSSTFIASIIGLVSSSLLNKLINIQPYEVAASTLTRCITSPLALAGAAITGADPTLSALIVVLTGLFGAAFGQLFLNVIKTDDPLSVGLAMGAAAHGLGASSLANEPEKFSGAIVSMTLTGLFTVILLSIESFRNLL